MSKSQDSETVRRIIEQHHRKVGGLQSILHEIQQTYGYLPPDALRLTADITGNALVDIYAVATFYDEFTAEPPSAHNTEREDAPQHLAVSCPRCKHGLTDPEHAIGERPSVRVTVAFGQEHGWFRFASIPRRWAVESEYPFPTTGEVNFFCPHCHAELFPTENCKKCGAPFVPILDEGWALKTVCSNQDCRFRWGTPEDQSDR